MAFKPLTKSSFKKFDVAGDSLEGHYLGFDMRDYEGKPYQSHKLQGRDGKIVRVSGSELDYKLRDVPHGMMTQITYKGYEARKSKLGKSFKVKTFSILVDEEDIISLEPESIPASKTVEKQLG
jgi:hypothetical protein